MNDILLIDKPVGKTSNNVINELKRLLNITKIGHSGTLDKFASGLLIICTGWATKLTRYFIESDKRYIGTVKLGVATDTCDIEGEITEQKDVSKLISEDILAIREEFTGEISQIPPQYSALKINGRRASDLMREGKRVELKERKIFINKLEILSIDLDNNRVTIDVDCSKGTYIRALARDIGLFLGIVAHLQSLRRTASGSFLVENAVTVEELRESLEGKDVAKKFRYSPEEATSHFRSITIKGKSRERVLNGVAFKKDEIIDIKNSENGPFRILDESENLVAIANIDIDSWNVKYLNVFNSK